jgi:hypothetical protein
MSFLLDTDISSAYLKNDPRVVGKVRRRTKKEHDH